jgi:L-iditol 2-dehydrogenase
LPDGFDIRCGAFLEPLSVALHAVRQSGFVAGQNALVFGAGPIGLLIGLWLQAFGARQVLMADVRPESLHVAQQIGLNDVADVRGPNWGSLPEFDVTVEAAGAGSALLAAIDRTRDKGTIAVVGRDTEDTIIPRQDFERLMRKEVAIRGCWGYNMTRKRDWDFVRHILSRQRFPLERLITHQVSLDEAPTTIRAMASRSIYYCKVLIELRK